MQEELSLQSAPNQHYLHYQQYPHSYRNHVQSFNFNDGYLHDCIAVANNNSIEVYEVKGNSIVFLYMKEFMCDITVLEVIKNKGNISDWLFIADDLGRYMFWDPNTGEIQVNNTLRKTQFTSEYFQKSQSEQKVVQYSGIKCHHNVYDTEASLFYTVDDKLIFLDLVIRKGKLHYRQTPIIVTVPYDQVIQIGMVDSKQNLIGIIANKEQKTFMYFHRIAQNQFNCIFLFQKPSLRRFFSHRDQLVLITISQISIYKHKEHNTIFQLNNSSQCSIQIAEQGNVCVLDDQKYLFVSEVCEQMIVFSQKHYKNYGSFVLDNDICIKVSCHGMLPDGGFLISVIDQGFTVEFLSVYESQWKSIRSIQGISPIFTIQDIAEGGMAQNLAVTRISDNFHQVGILSKRSPCNLKKQTQINSQILQVFSINNSKAILLSTAEDNTVYIFDSANDAYELGFQLLPGDIIMACDKYLVSSNKIYEIDLDLNRIVQKLQQNETIVNADFSGKYIGYQTENLKYKFYNVETGEIDRVRIKSSEEYIWKFHSPDLLLVGSFQFLDHIQALPIFQPIGTKIPLNTHQIVTDICSLGSLIAVSFISPTIQIYSMDSESLITSFNTANHSFHITQCNRSFLAYSAYQTYFFHVDHRNHIQVQAIQFDPQKDCINCLYLGSRTGILVAHESSIALYDAPIVEKNQTVANFRVVGVSMGEKQQENGEPPFVTYERDHLYIVNPYQIVLRNIQTAELLKKQSHSLKQIQCLQKFHEKGLLIAGLDDMENVQLLLVSFNSLEIVLVEALGKKVPTALKCTQKSNQFFLRTEEYISLYEIIDGEKLKLKFCSKTGLYGYTLAVNSDLNMLMISDPLRYAVAYDYSQGKLVAIARFRNNNTLNDIGFLQKSIVCSDCIGNIKALQFNFGNGEANQNIITEVGNIRVSSDITFLGDGNFGSLIYTGLTGSVGRIISISEQEFKQLKGAQNKMIEKISSSSCMMKYFDWRRRKDLQDKMIDDFLIKMYLQGEKDRKVGKIWEKLTQKFK